ncbi:MAG: hypothetical protein K0S88_1945 [Actinomycetia bacterium]|nr:hypothetical protein [Actinomycetes bacterium]
MRGPPKLRSKRPLTPTTAPASVRPPDQTAPRAMGRRSIHRPAATGGGRAASRPRTRGASPARDGRDHLRTAVAAAQRRGGRPRQGRAGPSSRRGDDGDGAPRATEPTCSCSCSWTFGLPAGGDSVNALSLRLNTQRGRTRKVALTSGSMNFRVTLDEYFSFTRETISSALRDWTLLLNQTDSSFQIPRPASRGVNHGPAHRDHQGGDARTHTTPRDVTPGSPT